jgi:very-short-patch-repair endonuclease
VAEYERRRVLCGNAAQFQGDERDIIFISMVNAPSASGKPLHLRVREDAKRVFNVAASRSRDQLWVVHSLEPGRDLKPNDLRLRLISHAENPDGLRPKSIDKKLRKLNSTLEEQVYDKLVEAKYSTLISCEVGEFVIDLAVIGAKGNRIAIQCDGDKEVSRKYLEKSLHRQLTLERLGWRFIRVRGSEFLRHPDEALGKIQKRLKKYDIEPRGLFTKDPVDKAAKEKSKELLSEVKKRAQMSRSRWKEIPSVSSIVRKSDTKGSGKYGELVTSKK